MIVPYRIIERLPTLDEYRRLCTAVGWGEIINLEAARSALPNSLYGVVATAGEKTVGMGRIIGDGAIFFYIQDIAVLPQHQGRGVGTMIMEALMAYLEQHAPAKAFIRLFAATGKEAFYEHYHFAIPNYATGMYRVLPATYN